MTREEIREGIDDILWELAAGEITTLKAKQRLGDLGVVLKVCRELPESEHTVKGEHVHGYYEYGQEDMLEAGYVAVEPLVEE